MPHPVWLILAGLAAGTALAIANQKPPGRRAEEAAAARRGLRRRGGPGQPDFGRTGEVKDWGRPVDAGTIEREFKKGRRELVAPGGFTAPARHRARYLGMRLRRS